jgi:gas vesicle protein
MGRLLTGVVIGFLIAVLFLPEDFQLRENLSRAWQTARVFVTELWSDVDEAADRAMEATEETAEDVERATEQTGDAVREGAQETRDAAEGAAEEGREAAEEAERQADEAVPETAPTEQERR